MFHWNRPAPNYKIQAKLDAFGSYDIEESLIGHTRMVSVKCSSCNRKVGPVWLTEKAVRKLGNSGKCWMCN